MKKRLTKILTLAVSALLILGAVIGFSVSASGTEEPATKIATINVSYEGAVKLVYDLTTNDSIGESDTQRVALFIWYDEDDVYNEDGSINFTTNVEKHIHGKDPAYEEDHEHDEIHYYSFTMENGIAPKDLRKPVYALAAVVTGDFSGDSLTTTGYTPCGEVLEFSPYDYVMGRLALTGTSAATDDQKALYLALLDFAGAVQDVLYESNINAGATEAEAKAAAGLEYGYADAYYIVDYIQTALIGGQPANVTTTYELRPGETVDVKSDATYMRRVFEKYLTSGVELQYLYQDGDSVVKIDEDQMAQGTARFVRVTPTAVGRTAFAARYSMEAGSAIYTSSLNGTAHSAATSADKSLQTATDGTYTTVRADAADADGNPYIVFSKQIRQISDPATSSNPRGGSLSLDKNADVATGDVHVTEFDVSTFLGNYVLDADGDAATTDDGTRDYNRFSTGKGQMLNLQVRGKDDSYFFRLEIYSNNDGNVRFAIATDGSSLMAKRTFTEDKSSYTDTLVSYSTGQSLYNWNRGTFANSITGETVISASEIKNIRLEVHHDGVTTNEYRAYHYDSTGAAIEENGSHKYDSYTILVPVLKLYVNDVYWGESKAPYFTPSNDTTAATNAEYVTKYGIALDKETLAYALARFNTTNDGAIELHVSNWLVSAYDYNADGTIALTNSGSDIDYGIGSSYDYDITTGGIKDNYSGVISSNGNTPLDTNPEDTTGGFAYIDVEDGDGALMMGKVEAGGSNSIYIKLPDEVVDAEKRYIVFSTDFYYDTGLMTPYAHTSKTDDTPKNPTDWIRFRFAEKAGSTDSNGSIDTFLVNPVGNITEANRDSNLNFEGKKFSTGEWVHLTLVFDCVSLTTDIYFNGTLIAEDQIKYNTHPGTEFKYLQLETRGYAQWAADKPRYGTYNHVTLGLDNTYFGYISEGTVTETNKLEVDPELSDNAKSYVSLETGLTDGDRTGVSHFHYTNSSTTDGSEAHLYWLAEEQMAKLEKNTYFVFETDIKIGTVTSHASYNDWLMYLSITDANVTDGSDGDYNSISSMVYYNSTAGTKFALFSTTGSNKLTIDTWHKLKIVYTRAEDTDGYDAVYVHTFLDGKLINSSISTKNTSNNKYDIQDAIWGFKMKCNNTKNFSEFNIYFDNTTLTEYTID